MTAHPSLPGAPGSNVLTANEVMQIVRAGADDIDFSTPTAVDPANNFGTPNGSPLLDTVRYPTTKGWDATFGYGRINVYEMLKAVRDRRIPPEAMIDGPTWFDVLPATGTAAVTGKVAAARATSYDYRVEWAPGLQPPLYPAIDTWRVAANRTGLRQLTSGRLATLDLAKIAEALPGGGKGAPIDPATGRPDEERFAVRLRVVVTAHGGAGDGLTGEMQKQVFVHDDPDLVRPLPHRVPGAGTSSPSFVDLDRRRPERAAAGHRRRRDPRLPRPRPVGAARLPAPRRLQPVVEPPVPGRPSGLHPAPPRRLRRRRAGRRRPRRRRAGTRSSPPT